MVSLHYSGDNALVEFYDNQNPQHPLALSEGWEYEIVRTVVVATGYTASGTRKCVIKHYVRMVKQ